MGMTDAPRASLREHTPLMERLITRGGMREGLERHKNQGCTGKMMQPFRLANTYGRITMPQSL